MTHTKSLRSAFLLFFTAFALFVSAAAQTSSDAAPLPGKISKQTFQSKLMARNMPFNVFLPPNYDEKLQKETHYSVVILLHGLTGHFDNWQKLSNLEKNAVRFNFIIVMPEGDDGWYTDSASIADDKYESYIIKELIPEIDSRYRTKAKRENRALAGLSMGGYGAIKFGLKYPENFALVGSFSGALGITDLTDKNAGAWVSKSVMSVYGEAGSETRKSNDIFHLVRQLNEAEIKSLPFIYQDCGTEDFLIQSNRDFVKLLGEKKIPHEYRELPGIHNWKFWDAQVQEFLRLSERMIAG